MKVALPSFDAVIFDLDGLILDTEIGFAAAWREALCEYGIATSDDFFHSLSGLSGDVVLERVAAHVGPRFDRMPFLNRAAAAWRAHVDRHGIPCLPGVHEMLELLAARGIPHALATNSEAHHALECLQKAGVADCFPLRATRDLVAQGKPAPDLVVEAARRLGVAPQRCLMLEDSTPGLLAAKRAGAIPVLVLNRQAPAESLQLAAARFETLIELAEALRGG